MANSEADDGNKKEDEPSKSSEKYAPFMQSLIQFMNPLKLMDHLGNEVTPEEPKFE